MRAVRISAYGGPSVLKLEELPDPEPGPNQVLVRNHAVGVNPVDTYLRANVDNRGPTLPYTPGSDAGLAGASHPRLRREKEVLAVTRHPRADAQLGVPVSIIAPPPVAPA